VSNAKKFNNDYFKNVLFNGWRPVDAKEFNNGQASPMGSKKYWVTADGTGVNSGAPHMLLNTDICLAYGTQNNSGLKHEAASGYRPTVTDDFDNTISTLQADMVGNNCCAWTNVRQFDKQSQKEHPVFFEAVANSDGSGYHMEKGKHCGRQYQSGNPKWACCQQTKHTDGDGMYDEDCSDNLVPGGPAMSAMHTFAMDDSTWLQYFRKAWSHSTTRRWNGQLQCPSGRRLQDVTDVPPLINTPTLQQTVEQLEFLQDLFQGDCVSAFHSGMPYDPRNLEEYITEQNTLLNVAWNSEQYTPKNIDEQSDQSLSTNDGEQPKVKKTLINARNIEFVFGAAIDQCDGSQVAKQATSPFRKLEGWCPTCKTFTVMMQGPDCPKLGQQINVKRFAGSDEFGLAKEEKTFAAYSFYCEKMSQDWNPSYDTYGVTTTPAPSRNLRRRLQDTPGSDKVLVIMQTETDEEPVPEDGITFETVEYVDDEGSSNEHSTWYLWVIGAFAILIFLLLIVIGVILYYCRKQKQQQKYVSRTRSTREQPALRQGRKGRTQKQGMTKP
jgi:hypothetical protein